MNYKVFVIKRWHVYSKSINAIKRFVRFEKVIFENSCRSKDLPKKIKYDGRLEIDISRKDSVRLTSYESKGRDERGETTNFVLWS